MAIVISKRRQAKRSSSTKGSNQGRPPKLVTYCPFCPTQSMANPENDRINVQAKTKRMTCKLGHSWPVGGQAQPGS